MPGFRAASHRRGSLSTCFPTLTLLVVAIDSGNGGTKKPPLLLVEGHHILLILRNISAGIGTWYICTGCRVSKGRFPPPLWISKSSNSIVQTMVRLERAVVKCLICRAAAQGRSRFRSA